MAWGFLLLWRRSAGPPEHDDMARATASVVGERDEKKRPGLELGYKQQGDQPGFELWCLCTKHGFFTV